MAIKKGFPVGDLPKYKVDGVTPYDWTGRPIQDTGDLPIAYGTANGGVLFVPRIVAIDPLYDIDLSPFQKTLDDLRIVRLAVGDAMPTPMNIDDPMSPWARALLAATPQLADTTAVRPERYVGGRLLVVCSTLTARASYVQTIGSYLTRHKEDSRPLCDSQPPTADGGIYSGGSGPIDVEVTETALHDGRVIDDAGALDILSASFDRIVIYFVKGPEGTLTTTTSAPEEVTCTPNNESQLPLIHLTGPVTTTEEPDADYTTRHVEDALFAAVTSPVVRPVDAPPSAAEIVAFFTAD